MMNANHRASHNSAKVAPDKSSLVTRDRIIAAESSPLSAAIDSVVQLQATLDFTIDAERAAIRDAIGRHQDNLRRREMLRSLAAELEARYLEKPPRRRRVAA